MIVMDPRTGEILAMASYPWFDPNAFAGRAEHLPQPERRTPYEPGSTNKVITAAAAIQEARSSGCGSPSRGRCRSATTSSTTRSRTNRCR